MNRTSTGLKGMTVIVLRKASLPKIVHMAELEELQAPNRSGGWPSGHFHGFISFLAKHHHSQLNQFEWDLLFRVRPKSFFFRV